MLSPGEHVVVDTAQGEYINHARGTSVTYKINQI
jgi:hypothetical protein